MRAGQDASVQTTLAMVADANRPAWQRAAVLRGAEVALVPNTPMPGTARRGAAPSITATAVATPGAPCPTCPGGRAGPGGAYAFDDARDQAARLPRAAGARGGGRGGRGAGGARRRAEASDRARTGGVCGARRRLGRTGAARGQRARQDRVAGKAGRGKSGDAVDRRRAAALRGGPRGLPQHLPGLPSARRPRARARRATARRFGAGAGAGGRHLADSAQRQGRPRRI